MIDCFTTVVFSALEQQLLTDILDQLQPDLKGHFSLKIPVDNKNRFNREYNRDYPRQKDIIGRYHFIPATPAPYRTYHIISSPLDIFYFTVNIKMA